MKRLFGAPVRKDDLPHAKCERLRRAEHFLLHPPLREINGLLDVLFVDVCD